MASFGPASRSKLDTCHPDLILIAERVIEIFDFSVLEGRRDDALQYQYFLEGKSQLDGITNRSNHQVDEVQPLSMALDAAPYPINFQQVEKAKARFYMMAGYFFQAAADLYREGKISHTLRWGGDWDGDKEFKDQSFDDLPHFELQ